MALRKQDVRALVFMGLVAAGAIPYGAYEYFYKDWDRWGREIAQKQEELAQAEAAARRLSILQAERARLQRAFEESKRRLPERGEIVTLDRRLTDLLKECGVAGANIQTVNIAAEAPVAAKPYNAIPIDIQLVNVEWSSLLAFFDTLHRLDRLIDVNQCNIAPVPGSSNRYNVTMHLETYVLPEAGT